MQKKSIISKIIFALIVVAFISICAIQAPISSAANTLWALFPPVLAIGLALITKEVYSSLFLGIIVGALMNSGFSFAGTVDTIVNDGFIASVSDSAGIFVFLVILGIIVALINKAGGSAAFGAWARVHIKTKVGAAMATFVLGVLIFIDDYFNCLTVGSVMRPVTDSHNMSRSKLAYLIDATAAPVCMIAPISSWAAAVSQYADGTKYSGLEMFIKAIPYNFYSILTFVFIITISLMKFDYGPMKKFEIAAENGNIVGDDSNVAEEEAPATSRGKIWDLILPIIALVVASVFGLIYVGGYFKGESFVDSFANTDAFVGLPWGGIIALVAIVIYLVARRVLTFKQAMECVPSGFIAMVPAILILTLATSLKNITTLLGAKDYVGGVMENAASGLFNFLPAVIFLVACLLAFATGTSWGTFGILIPIVVSIFPESSPLLFIGMSACLAGAVCGDHCSPISDTTIMSSAGAQCNHVDHVTTQLPYAVTVAAVSFVSFIIASFIQNAVISLAIAIVLMIAVIFVIRVFTAEKAK